MASLRQIRQRIRSIQNSKQIMRAMQLVSASKFKRSQAKLLEGRDTLGFLDGLLERLLAATPALDHPLCAVREGGESTLVVFTSDAGLCGSYNANLISMAEAHLRRDSAAHTQVIYIGKKGHRHFTKRGFAAEAAYLDLAGRPNLETAAEIGQSLIDRFLDGRTSSVKVLYSRFISSMVYKPTLTTFLPATLERTEASATAEQYIFEPSPDAVFQDLLPRWALATFQLMLLEAFTSEHSARMIAMKNATDNAEELLEEFTRQHNRMRQAGITKDLSEIVGTAEALK